jgi:Derlin-2/3
VQIWRPLTNFLFLGNFGLNYVLTAHFMWTYMSYLERMRCKDPAEFLVMVLFGAASLVVTTAVCGQEPVYLGHNLSCYLVYIWSRAFEGQDVDVMGLFHLSAHLLPWFFVAQSMLLERMLPVSDLLGIAVGLVYHSLATRKVLRAPAFLRRAFAQKKIRRMYKKFEDELQ